MQIVKIYDLAYSWIMWIVLNKICSNNIVRRYVACIAQVTGGYIKGNKIKHILPKFFYKHEFKKRGDIDIQQLQ